MLDEQVQLKRDVKELTNIINHMEEKLDKSLDDSQEIKFTLKSVLILLTGNRDLNPDDKGMIGRIEKLSSRMTVVELWKNRGFWWLGGAAFGFGCSIGPWLYKLLNK